MRLIASMKNPNYYIDPDVFLETIVAWIDRGRNFSDQDELAVLYYKLAEKTVARFGRGHLDPYDLIQEGVTSCCKRAKHFKPEKGSPFNFFTKIIKNSISTAYEKENRKHNPAMRISIDDSTYAFSETLVDHRAQAVVDRMCGRLAEENPIAGPSKRVVSVEDLLILDEKPKYYN